MGLSRRSFLGVLAAVPLSRGFGGPAPGAAPLSATCALPESRAGFARALALRDTRDVLVFPGAAGWDESIEPQVRSGRLVIFESASAFVEPGRREEQRAGLRSFGLTVEEPVALWSEDGRPSYVDLVWPVRTRVRDFSFATPVGGGETIGRLGELPMAALQRAGAGALLFLGSPVGPALWSGDPEAHAWLSSILDQPPTRAVRSRSQAGAMAPATPAAHSATTIAVNTSIV